MKYFIIAGEASGDIHAGNLITEMKHLAPDDQFQGWGGDRMEDAGCQILKHYKELAFMGFWEVFTNLPTILRNFKTCISQIEKFKPDAVILVDYPGFNLRIAKYAHQHNIKVYYYISPQVWAWKNGRVKNIKKYVDKMLVILPFEKAFYQQYDYKVHYVGNPLLDEIKTFRSDSETAINFRAIHGLDERPIVAILPGSRKQEIKTMLPTMVKMREHFPDYQFVISAVKWQPRKLYTDITNNIPLVDVGIYPLLMNANAAIVTSGTVSLETSLMNVPQIVCYKGNPISYFIARRLVKGISYISLSNLILDKQIFNELIQYDFNEKRLTEELTRILHDPNVIHNMKSDYQQLRKILGDGGASEKAAREFLLSL
ncbi:lipid-A-disaccharide synthase [Bacteroidales bacterium OttesenSCG-928-B11]|nr:lipid-A-disaccharide synthase [Bacteroidales bacterium OttesenSCG-928-C03]MDL2312785.1 lipid-A-disaccharide synthase [Bacteroidales bacterium OttesenSCG-928-B11]MDL2325869.1 lipid-A-disaccharide synthase [Bacteroidales bacterium OttesenSCG-928-A14]